MNQIHDLLRAQMGPLEYENMLLKQQVWDLAFKLDPIFWETVIRESGIEAKERLDADLKDAKTSPRATPDWMEGTKVYSRQDGKVKVLEKKIP